MPRRKIARSAQLCNRPEVKKQLAEVARRIEEGFQAQIDRSNENVDYWDIYNCKLTANQFYHGTSRNFVPIVHNAVEARKTRFMNQVFPLQGRYVEVDGDSDDIPYAQMALLEHYVERAGMRDRVIPALLITGDVEGQLTVLVTWGNRKRHQVWRLPKPPEMFGQQAPAGIVDIMVTEEEVTEDTGPEVEIIQDSDFLVEPVNVDSIDEALEMGGSVTAIRRWTKARCEELIDSGEFDKAAASDLMREWDYDSPRNIEKRLSQTLGIQPKGEYAKIARTWCKIKVADEKRLVLAYFAGGDQLLGARLCPYWCDMPDYITAAVKKLPGQIKGMSQVKPCAGMQYAANDALNEGLDSAILTLQPVVRVDPEKVPNIDGIVVDQRALWQAPQGAIEPLVFPPYYAHAFEIILAAERYINMTLGVNPAMLPQSTSTKTKRSQAEVAMEQAVDLLQTSDSVTIIEKGILSPLIERFALYDAQFRDTEIDIRSHGKLGIEIERVTVPPYQMGHRWTYRWFGVEAARTAQQIQQQIAFINVLRGMAQDPSVMQEGYRLNLIPFIKSSAENVFGPRIAPEIFSRINEKLSLDPDTENELMSEGFDGVLSPLDDDVRHLRSHTAAARQGDPWGKFAMHIAAHQQQMQKKAMAQMIRQMQQALGPGGPPPPGMAQPRGAAQGRMPQTGAQPDMPRVGRQPPGAIPPSEIEGGLVQMPRRM